MSKMLQAFVGVTFFAAACLFVAMGQTDIETAGAIAQFSQNGIDGQVIVMNGHIILNLTFDDGFDFNSIGGESCFEGGLHWGIYDAWEHSDYKDKIGSDSCSSANTGDRWDPWLACSSASANEYCTTNGECIPPQSYKGGDADEYEYVCNEYSYVYDPFVCEMGDMSGKYGLLQLDSDNNYQILADYSSSFEIDSYDLGGKSIVFRCHDTTRAFCSGFDEYEPTDDETDTFIRPYQNDSLAYSQKAQIGDNSFVILSYRQVYSISIDSSDFGVPGSCGDEIYYRIFNNWDATGTDCEEKTGDFFYDPSITCAYNTEATDDSGGLGWCQGDGVCGDGSYEYSCGYYETEPYNRLNCGPGDLSGKYGTINIKNNVNFVFNKTGYDPKMIPMSKVVGKSIVLQCSSDYAIIACAPFLDWTDDAGQTNGGGSITFGWSGNNNNNNNNENENENDSSSKESDSFLGVSNTVVLIMVLLALASIVPCVRGCRNRKAGAATGVNDKMYDADGANDTQQREASRQARGGGKKGFTARFKDKMAVVTGDGIESQSTNHMRQQSQSGNQYGRHESQYSQSGGPQLGMNGKEFKQNKPRTMPSMQSGPM